MNIGTMLCRMIVVLIFIFLNEVYAVPCTVPGLTMCDCTGTIVDCRNQGLQQIPSTIPPDTTYLRLRGNNITSVDSTSLSGLTSLLVLELADNKISNIENGAFSDLQSLRNLFLFNNKLSSFRPDTFTSLGSMIELALFDNILTTVSANIFAKSTVLQTLSFDRNPLVCCSMTDWFGWAANQTIANFFSGTCTDFDTITELRDFNVSKCPVDGAWSSWSNQTCSVTCGNGILSRNRTCDSPEPSAGGKTCNGSSVETSDCSLSDCPVDGGWGSWSNPTCSVTCGNGIQSRNRSCDSPVPSADGKICNGSSVDTSDCSLRDCPVDGGWGSWSNPICSVTCGNGIQSRNRSCDSPIPSADGQTCNGSSVDTSDCSLRDCPVDGGWGSWSNPTCSVTCGNGIQSRNRSCDSPVPSADGKICNGSSVDTSDCSLRDCPVDGGWGSWSNPICSVTCGNGIQSRNRSCDSPVPSADGQTCNGSSVDTSDCRLRDCPVDGGWGSWSNPTCSVTCGNGIQSRNRSCDSPVPSADGKICNGSSVDTSDCSLRDCPVDGGWGSWSNPICSVTCGNGIQSRNRSCDSPVPSADGQTCNGSSVDTSDCSLRDCPVDGGWGSWSNPICSVTCGNGIKSRNRACDSPVPSADGQTCNGSSVDTSDCSLSDCPVDGQWGSWSTGPCSVTCGNGIRYRKRSCDSPPASNNGQGCIGSCTVSVICTLELCSESRKWKGYHGIRLNSRKYHGTRLNSRRYHGTHVRLNSSRYHGIRLNSRRYHGIRLNSRIYHGIRLNSRRYHGRRLNSRRYHGIRLNSRIYHGRRLNSRRYHGRRLNSSRYHGRRLNSRRYHGIRLNSRIYH